MRLALATGLLLAVAVRAAGEGADRPFASSLPDSVGDVTGWTVVTGDFRTQTARGTYRLYVNPARAGMYQLMRYRVELLAPPSAAEERPGHAERVAFVRRPGTREPMVCWEWQGPGPAPSWRELSAGSEEYLREMHVLMRVLAAHGAAGGSSAP
jgi:hypothetical protein